MICLKTQLRFSLFVLLGLLPLINSCGVKGDPLPPEKPAEIGRGRPTYRRATEGLRVKDKHEEDEQDERE